MADEEGALADELRRHLAEYEAQVADLSAVIAAHQHGESGVDASSAASAAQLKQQLEEAAQLTEKSLLNLRKASLLRSLEVQPPPPAASHAFTVGSSCQALLPRADGSGVWLDAVVHNAVTSSGNGRESGEPAVLVRFTTPTQLSLKPCRHFFSSAEGCCPYGDRCRLFHGYVAPLSRLRLPSAQLHGYSVGSKCLALYKPEGLWYPATVLAAQPEQGSYVLMYDGYESEGTHALLASEIAPLPEITHGQTTANQRKEGDKEVNVDEPCDNQILERLGMETHEMNRERQLQALGRDLGSWEAHTLGFGGRMLEKMGFTFGSLASTATSSGGMRGSGLGKIGQGRRVPVLPEAHAHPSGVGLDEALAHGRTEKQLTQAAQREAAGRVQKHIERARREGDGAAVPSAEDLYANYSMADIEAKRRKDALSEVMRRYCPPKGPGESVLRMVGGVDGKTVLEVTDRRAAAQKEASEALFSTLNWATQHNRSTAFSILHGHRVSNANNGSATSSAASSAFGLSGSSGDVQTDKETSGWRFSAEGLRRERLLHQQLQQQRQQGREGESRGVKENAKEKQRQMRVQLLSVQEQIRRARGKCRSLEGSVRRNMQSSSLVRTLKGQLTLAESELKQLETVESELQREIAHCGNASAASISKRAKRH